MADKEIKGLKELIEKLEKLKGINTKKALLKGAYVLQKKSMINAPIKFGFLRGSHESRETEEGAEMVVNANYSFYVEFGTKKWAGKPFVRPAIDSEKDSIEKAVAKEIVREVADKLE